MKVLLFLCLFSNLSFSFKPDVEGGMIVPNNKKYKHFIRIETIDGYSCTATKVAKNKLITAAHCVIDHNSIMLYKVGDKILDYGTVKSVNVHPNYIDAQKNLIPYSNQLEKLQKKAATMSPIEIKKLIASDFFVNLKRKLTLTSSKKSQSDIAFIELNKEFSEDGFPQIINKKHNFKKRGNFELVGFGTTKKTWNAKLNGYKTTKMAKNGSLAKSCWNKDPLSYETDRLTDDIIGILDFDATIKHSIEQEKDIQTYSQNMLMPGDSGSSAIEYDENNKQIITAIASTVADGVVPDSKMKLKISLENGTEKIIVFDQAIKNWGDPQKNDLEYIEIIQKLDELGLFDLQKGGIKSGVKLSREYTRESSARFADLLHPNNQEFIKTVMNP